MKKYLLTFIVLLATFAAEAQTLLRRAEIAYEGQNYRTAVVNYEKYLARKGELSPEATRALANSHFYLKNYSEAIASYEKIDDNDMSSLAWFNYGEIKRQEAQYEEALELYQKAKKARKKNINQSRINLGIKACQWAIEHQEAPRTDKATLSPSGLKTYGQSFGLRFYKDGLLYSSSSVDVSKKKNQDANGKPILNLAFYVPPSDSASGGTHPFSETISSKSNVGAADFSEDGKTIYYTKLVKVNKAYKSRIFTAEFNEEMGDWVREQVLPFCVGDYNYAHPTLSKDGNTLYFSSDMRGSRGGMDIFQTVKGTRGWGRPKNLGSIVNTAGHEIFPYLTPEGDLSFASDAHPGYGGLDVFWADMKNGRPVSIRNAKRPINSSWDDFAFVISPQDSLLAYLSSNRDSEGAFDSIYVLDMSEDYLAELHGEVEESPEELDSKDMDITDPLTLALENQEANKENERSLTALQEDAEFLNANPNSLYGAYRLRAVETYLADALSMQPLANAEYEIIDNITQEVIISAMTDDSARLRIDLKAFEIMIDQPLTITATMGSGDFSSYTLQLISDRMRFYDEDNPIMLTPIMDRRDKVKENIVASEEVTGGAPFEFDDYMLTAAGKNYLDAWADFLVKNPNVKIKLMTHTDSRGEVAYNFKLSQRRAFEAKRYLITRGVNHMQVIARGYGERYPLVDCTDCTEKEHAANRRIEVEVINLNKK